MSLSINQLDNLWVNNGERPTKVDFKEWLADVAFNNVVTMVAGKRYYGEDVDEVNQRTGGSKDGNDRFGTLNPPATRRLRVTTL